MSKVHRVKFYNPQPEPISCSSFNHHQKYLAIARFDASIEVWDIKYAPFMIRCIPAIADGSVEALVWVGSRLISTGLGGALIEWDLEKLNIKNTVLLTGNEAWCLDVHAHSNILAVGTEQGYVNLFSVANDEIIYSKLFDKQEGRVMCCKFNKEGDQLVTGSVASIRIWNVKTGHATTKINVNRRGIETIVWCVGVLSDGVVVSGDSHGRLTFWDMNLGNQIESYSTHKGNILALAITEDEKELYCSGVDPVIAKFVKIDTGKDKQSNAQWAKHVPRHIHEHDVRTLVINDHQLISLGADGYLSLSSRTPPMSVLRLPPMPLQPSTAICAKSKMLLLRYGNRLEVWKLGNYATDDNGKPIIANNTKLNKSFDDDTANDKIKTLEILEQPTKLVTIHSKKYKMIISCDMSSNGKLIVYSTEDDTRMLKLDMDDEGTLSLSKMAINGLPSSCDRLSFCDDQDIVVGHSNGSLLVLFVDTAAEVIQTIPLSEYLTPSIIHLVVRKISKGQTFLVAADSTGSISIWQMKKNKTFTHYSSLPKYRCVPSALCVDKENNRLLVVYVDQKIVEYDLPNKKFTDWHESQMPNKWTERKSSVLSVSPRRDGMVCHDETSLWLLEKKTQEVSDDKQKKRKGRQSIENNKEADINCIEAKKKTMKYLAGFHWLSNDEAVAIEILPESIVAQLPPVPVTKKQFRT